MCREPLISVAVCTFNRSRYLRNVLADLCAQTLARERYEILVVDNASTDETAQVAAEFTRAGGNVRYLHEPQQGLSHARNRGWHEARGEYVGYTDDDCRVPPEWLAVAEQIILEHRPAAFGGPYYPFYDDPRPVWFRDEYGTAVRSSVAGPLTRPEDFLSGGNMFFQRKVLEWLGGFDVAHGKRGWKLGYGEESALQKALRMRMPGNRIYYDPRLAVRHLMPPGKMTLCYQVRDRFARGRAAWHLAPPGGERTAQEMLLWGWAELRALVAALARIRRRDWARFPYWQNYVMETVLPHVLALGVVYECYRTRRRLG